MTIKENVRIGRASLEEVLVGSSQNKVRRNSVKGLFEDRNKRKRIRNRKRQRGGLKVRNNFPGGAGSKFPELAGENQ